MVLPFSSFSVDFPHTVQSLKNVESASHLFIRKGHITAKVGEHYVNFLFFSHENMLWALIRSASVRLFI